MVTLSKIDVKYNNLLKLIMHYLPLKIHIHVHSTSSITVPSFIETDMVKKLKFVLSDIKFSYTPTGMKSFAPNSSFLADSRASLLARRAPTERPIDGSPLAARQGKTNPDEAQIKICLSSKVLPSNKYKCFSLMNGCILPLKAILCS